MYIVTEVPDYIINIVNNTDKIGRKELAKLANISEQEARIVLRILNNKSDSDVPVSAGELENTDKIYTDYKDDTAKVTTTSLTVNTLEQALEIAEVDLGVWEVERHVINSWQVHMKLGDGEGKHNVVARTNYQVKIWLKAKVIKPLELAMKMLIEQLPQHKPTYADYIGDPDGKIMLEISLFDAHFGLLAWEPETGEDYDIHIAEEVYHKTVERIIERAGHYDIAKIIFPIGNDFFHINNPEGLTPKGKKMLDMDTRLPKIYKAGKMAIIKAIDYCMGIADVELLWVPGNHDPETSFYLCDALSSYYRNTDRVTVDISPKCRKYRKWGNGMVGYTHGDEEPHRDLPAIMAGEVKDMWADTTYREWHLGHLHKKKQMYAITGDTYGGVIVKIIPSISSTDAWHYKKGYVNKIKAGEAFVWHKEEGVINTITVMTDNL